MSNFTIMIAGLGLAVVFVVALGMAFGVFRSRDEGRPDLPGQPREADPFDYDAVPGVAATEPDSRETVSLDASWPDSDSGGRSAVVAYDVQPDPVTGELAAVRVDDLEEPSEEDVTGWLHEVHECLAEEDWQTAEGWQAHYPPLAQPEDEDYADQEVVLVALADFHAGLAADWAVTCRWVAVNERMLAA